MLSRPQITLLALLATSSIAQASWLDDGINNILRRQDDSNDTTESLSATLSITPSISTPTVTGSETSTPTVSETATISETETIPTSSSTPSVTPTPTPTPSITPSSTLSSSQTSTSTEQEEEQQTTTQPSVTKETTVASITQTPTIVKVTQTKTVNGNLVTTVSESTGSAPAPTKGASNQAEGSESSGEGMSSKTKSTIIGVVVGVGGAILLGGLAIVAWRIWGRKKSEDEGDDLMAYSRPDTAGQEKSGSAGAGGPGSNPFQSTLESYHNPKQVNASSNF